MQARRPKPDLFEVGFEQAEDSLNMGCHWAKLQQVHCSPDHSHLEELDELFIMRQDIEVEMFLPPTRSLQARQRLGGGLRTESQRRSWGHEVVSNIVACVVEARRLFVDVGSIDFHCTRRSLSSASRMISNSPEAITASSVALSGAKVLGADIARAKSHTESGLIVLRAASDMDLISAKVATMSSWAVRIVSRQSRFVAKSACNPWRMRCSSWRSCCPSHQASSAR